MLIEGSTRSILLPEAPPFARRRGLRCVIANLLAQHRGARDLRQPFGSDGLQPAVATWHRQADQIAAKIDDALCARLAKVDQRIHELIGIAQQQGAAVAELASRLDDASVAADEDEHGIAGSDSRRLVRATRTDLDVRRASLAAAARELRELSQTRQHLRVAARDVADSWSRRCDELSAFHRRGYHARQARTKVGDPSSTPPLPAHHITYGWAEASEPVIDPALG